MARRRNRLEGRTNSSDDGPPPGIIKILKIKWGVNGVRKWSILLFVNCLGESKNVISLGESFSTIAVERLLFSTPDSNNERRSGVF